MGKLINGNKKKCNHCGKIKLLTEFQKNGFAHVHICKECAKEERKIKKEKNELLEKENQQLKEQINKAINYIDQVIMYHISNFDYKTVYDDLDRLIGILSRKEEK